MQRAFSCRRDRLQHQARSSPIDHPARHSAGFFVWRIHDLLHPLARRAEAAWRWPNFSPAEIACRGTGKLLVNEAALDRAAGAARCVSASR